MPIQIVIGRLRQRKIVQWALAYLAGAWMVMQLVDRVVGSLGDITGVVAKNLATTTRDKAADSMTPYEAILQLS